MCQSPCSAAGRPRECAPFSVWRLAVPTWVGIVQSPEGLKRTNRWRKGGSVLCLSQDISDAPRPLDFGWSERPTSLQTAAPGTSQPPGPRELIPVIHLLVYIQVYGETDRQTDRCPIDSASRRSLARSPKREVFHLLFWTLRCGCRWVRSTRDLGSGRSIKA